MGPETQTRRSNLEKLIAAAVEATQEASNNSSLKRPGLPQRTQYPLIKEYALNHNMKPPIITGIVIVLNQGVLVSLGRLILLWGVR